MVEYKIKEYMKHVLLLGNIKVKGEYTDMKNKYKISIIIFSTLIMIVAIILLGPMDYFTHGFFYNEIDCSQIAKEDYLDSINLEKDKYEMKFSPLKAHMAGFEIYLTNQANDNNGKLDMTIFNHEGDIIDYIEVDLSKVNDSTWYKVYTSARFNVGEEYTLRFSAKDCRTYPYLQNVDSFYLPKETLSGNILLTYAYAMPTFTFQDKILISLFIIIIWLFAISVFLSDKNKKIIRIAAGVLFMVLILSWNYMYNTMDNQNVNFSDFQADSETLVTGVIYAERDGIGLDSWRGGLGRYYNLKGKLDSYKRDYLTDDNWINGYSKTKAAILINSNEYSKQVAQVGNYITFGNGEKFQIQNIEDDNQNIVIYLDTEKILPPAQCGSLDDVVFYDCNSRPLETSWIIGYSSQYGLQGKIFKHLARYVNHGGAILNLNLLCSIVTAFIFVIIVMLISAKYNKLMAGCFFITFWLSPWIVNFARNLYWVEFTWFIPMAIGLFCAWKIHDKKCRLLSYIGIFIAILVKCLCGYEYVSVIMLGMISFLLVDFLLAIIKKDKNSIRLLFRTVVIMGTAALLGFVVAICIHASIRSEGNIIEGVKSIFYNVALRRTDGADLNELDPANWPSLNASKWETCCKYFHFGTEIIVGIPGNLFPLLCVIPLGIFSYEYNKKCLDVELLAMYVIFFITSVSWFYLAKGHSYVHVHMNYVLWYFGFVQICIYIIVKNILVAFRKDKI